MSYVKYGVLALLVALLGACNQMSDDLSPSGEDLRPAVTANSIGYMPGQTAADFTLKTTLDEDFVLSDSLAGGSQPADVVVLYFTMWCPICLTHSDHIFNTLIPQFESQGDVVYALVDYVSGSIVASRAAETANGYAGSRFVTLVDVDRSVMDQFNAAMGSVVMIGRDGTILLNEDYRNGDASEATLAEYFQ